MDCQSGNNQPTTPMHLRASLRHHSVQEIYDYIQRVVAEPAMKIKKGQAIIGFDRPQYYEKFLKIHKISYINDKKVQFFPITKEQEQVLQFGMYDNQPPRKTINLIDDTKNAPPPISILSNDRATLPNEISVSVTGTLNNAMLNNQTYFNIAKKKNQLMEKLQSKFSESLQKSKKIAHELGHQFKDKEIKKRELFAFQSMVKLKLKQIQSNNDAQLMNLLKAIQDFSPDEGAIDLEPTFRYQQKSWQFTASQYVKPKFTPKIKFGSEKRCNLKRLAAISNEQFAATILPLDTFKQGYVKFYNVNNVEASRSFRLDTNVYSVCKVNNFMLLGCFDNTIKYVNLKDQQFSIESSQKMLKPSENQVISKEQAEKIQMSAKIYEIKLGKPSETSPSIYFYASDGRIHHHVISFDQPIPGLWGLHFEQKWASRTIQECKSIQVIDSSNLLVGEKNKVTVINTETQKSSSQVKVGDLVERIKKFRPHLFAVADTTNVKMVDLRVGSATQTFTGFKTRTKSLQVIGPNHIVYGAFNQIGLLDDRRPDAILWRSPEGYHSDQVSDIIKVQDKIISGDYSGRIFSWALREQQMKPQTIHTQNTNMGMGGQ